MKDPDRQGGRRMVIEHDMIFDDGFDLRQQLTDLDRCGIRRDCFKKGSFSFFIMWHERIFGFDRGTVRWTTAVHVNKFASNLAVFSDENRLRCLEFSRNQLLNVCR